MSGEGRHISVEDQPLVGTQRINMY